MNKVLSFIVHNRKNILKTLAVVGVAIGAYAIAHKAGTMERGYEAIGGEVFIPFLIICAKDIWKMFKAPFKALSE